MSADAPAGASVRRLVTPDDVGPEGVTLAFEAAPAEREALARRLDLLALDALAAALRFEAAGAPAGAIRVSGTIRARLVQSCVVTLKPVPGELQDTISVLYAPGPAEEPAREVEVPAEGEAPEPLPAEGIDASALVAEHLALLVDPYPRHPDAPAGPLTYETGDGRPTDADTGDDGTGGPFAALGQLKSKL